MFTHETQSKSPLRYLRNSVANETLQDGSSVVDLGSDSSLVENIQFQSSVPKSSLDDMLTIIREFRHQTGNSAELDKCLENAELAIQDLRSAATEDEFLSKQLLFMIHLEALLETGFDSKNDPVSYLENRQWLEEHKAANLEKRYVDIEEDKLAENLKQVLEAAPTEKKASDEDFQFGETPYALERVDSAVDVQGEETPRTVERETSGVEVQVEEVPYTTVEGASDAEDLVQNTRVTLERALYRVGTMKMTFEEVLSDELRELMESIEQCKKLTTSCLATLLYDDLTQAREVFLKSVDALEIAIHVNMKKQAFEDEKAVIVLPPRGC